MSETADVPEQLPLPSDATDRVLMVRAGQGDTAAALALVDRYTGPLFNLAHRATGLTSVATDVVGRTLGSSIRELADRVPPADRRWIVDLAGRLYRRLLGMGLRADQPTHRVRISPRRWEPARLEVSASAGPGAQRVVQKLRQRLWRAYSELTLRERFVIALVETAQTSLAELADVLGESEASARAIRDQAKLELMSGLVTARPTWKAWLRERRTRRRP